RRRTGSRRGADEGRFTLRSGAEQPRRRTGSRRGADEGGTKQMDFDVAPDDDPRRVAVREWLAAHPSPSGADLAAAGYVAPHWPRPYGLDADPIHQLILDEELRRVKV